MVAGEDGSPVVLGPSEVIPKSVANVRLNVRVLNVIMQHMAESCLALPIIDMVMAAVEQVGADQFENLSRELGRAKAMPIGQVPALQEDPSEGQDDTIPIHFIYIYIANIIII